LKKYTYRKVRKGELQDFQENPFVIFYALCIEYAIQQEERDRTGVWPKPLCPMDYVWDVYNPEQCWIDKFEAGMEPEDAVHAIFDRH